MPGSVVGIKKLLIVNEPKEEKTHSQNAARNVEFRDLVSWDVVGAERTARLSSGVAQATQVDK